MCEAKSASVLWKKRLNTVLYVRILAQDYTSAHTCPHVFEVLGHVRVVSLEHGCHLHHDISVGFCARAGLAVHLN